MKDKIIAFFSSLPSSTWATKTQIAKAVKCTLGGTFFDNLDSLIKDQILTKNYSPKDREYYYALSFRLPYKIRVLAELLKHDFYCSSYYISKQLEGTQGWTKMSSISVESDLNALRDLGLVVEAGNSLGERVYKAKTREIERTLYEPPNPASDLKEAEKNYNELAAKHDRLKCEHDALQEKHDKLNEEVDFAEGIRPDSTGSFDIKEKITEFFKKLPDGTWAKRSQIITALRTREPGVNNTTISSVLASMVAQKTVTYHQNGNSLSYFALSSRLFLRDRVLVALVNNKIEHRDNPNVGATGLSCAEIAKSETLSESLVQTRLDKLFENDLITGRVVTDLKTLTEVTKYSARSEEFDKILYQSRPYEAIEERAEIIAEQSKVIEKQQAEIKTLKELTGKTETRKSDPDDEIVLNYLVEKKKGTQVGSTCSEISDSIKLSVEKTEHALEFLAKQGLLEYTYAYPALYAAKNDKMQTTLYDPGKSSIRSEANTESFVDLQKMQGSNSRFFKYENLTHIDEIEKAMTACAQVTGQKKEIIRFFKTYVKYNRWATSEQIRQALHVDNIALDLMHLLKDKILIRSRASCRHRRTEDTFYAFRDRMDWHTVILNDLVESKNEGKIEHAGWRSPCVISSTTGLDSDIVSCSLILLVKKNEVKKSDFGMYAAIDKSIIKELYDPANGPDRYIVLNDLVECRRCFEEDEHVSKTKSIREISQSTGLTPAQVEVAMAYLVSDGMVKPKNSSAYAKANFFSATKKGIFAAEIKAEDIEASLPAKSRGIVEREIIKFFELKVGQNEWVSYDQIQKVFRFSEIPFNKLSELVKDKILIISDGLFSKDYALRKKMSFRTIILNHLVEYKNKNGWTGKGRGWQTCEDISDKTGLTRQRVEVVLRHLAEQKLVIKSGEVAGELTYPCPLYSAVGDEIEKFFYTPIKDLSHVGRDKASPDQTGLTKMRDAISKEIHDKVWEKLRADIDKAVEETNPKSKFSWLKRIFTG